jgi:hypothetical protein
MSTPSPTTAPAIQLKDTGIASYIEFPEDTFFMESLAHNSAFSTDAAYVPVQRYVNGREESHLYEVAPNMAEAKHVAGPICAPDGSIAVTIFGSALTSKGILYLCAFNRNSILALDLTKLPDKPGKVVCELEVGELPSPNDVCIDPADESTLFVVGGTFRRLCGCCCTFTNSGFGQVMKVSLASKVPVISQVADDLFVLAGCEVINDKLWIAQLVDIVSQPVSGGKIQTEWDGTTADKQVWLADNIDVFDNGEYTLCPAYSTVSEFIAKNIMRRPYLFSGILLYYQIATCFMKGETFNQALHDPEVSLSFSNTYISEDTPPAPVRLIFQNTTDNTQVFHFEVDLAEARAKNAPREIKDRETGAVLGKRHFFNEQVTHAAHLKFGGEGFVACVNFEQPRILLLKDDVFRDHMKAGHQAVIA